MAESNVHDRLSMLGVTVHPHSVMLNESILNEALILLHNDLRNIGVRIPITFSIRLDYCSPRSYIPDPDSVVSTR